MKGEFPYPNVNLFQFSNGGHEFVYLLYALYGVSLIFSILGFHTKISLIVAFICMVSFHQRNIWLLSSSEVLMRMTTFLLIFTPCGKSLSIDSLIGKIKSGRYQRRNYPVWGVRLIQIQVCVVYLTTVWHKLKGDTWFDGSAVYYATRLEGLYHLSFFPFMDLAWFLKIGTWTTLMIEFFLGFFIWFKEFRKPLLLAGVS